MYYLNQSPVGQVQFLVQSILSQKRRLYAAIAVALKCGHGTSSMKCKIDPNSEVNKKLKSTSFSTTNASYPSQAKFD
ncbi:hypothetical protein D0Y65_026284 [Glycine soja]|uniref:Uncharacterized protein n=1 Tax=Glycine soja TaxID=3848 RepID=A0A445IJD2_GLYSO|nr:hypothetical protein D0Y65_026284 [Glycine soja]